MGHVCEVCSQDVGLHDSRCSTGEPDRIDHPAYVTEGGTEMKASVEWSPFHTHLPALCCPGCPCRSYETAHPESIGLPVAERISDKRLLRILSYQNVLTMEELTEQRYALGSWRGVGLKRNLALWRAIRDFEKERAHDAAVQ